MKKITIYVEETTKEKVSEAENLDMRDLIKSVDKILKTQKFNKKE